MIRQATIQDASAIAQIHIHTWEIAYSGIVPDSHLTALSVENRTQRWLSTLSKSLTNTLVYQLDGKLVGWISLGISRDQDVSEAGEIYAIYVQPEMWGYGIGKDLMKFGEEQLWQRKVKSIVLWVLEDNFRARKFYQKGGYTLDGTKKELTIGEKMLSACRYVKYNDD
ncbi:GNAT family N-acetyltransferase [Mastigocoleus sp. MO_188.B34]|uniref:GNAT family N-acetyltransferase n=1 Tax=Mastigocoleus sp. MO_188.B34 TaxID=3036635 RepID=UPI00262FB39A|nr:GNAT family N-acetyltransferase [Mastigocoleus sp. MO_188.B34]MDJ0692874.1 GNAT family N-acetyltransferase [Mastigocoleus sp. MO_188.B34]